MTSRAFIDTNVLVYSIDKHSPAKRRRAREILRAIGKRGSAALSTQVIQEFYVAATGRLGADALETKEMIGNMPPLDVVVVDLPLIKEAIDCHLLNRLSFWDALIVVTAEKANCDVLFTEDLNHGQVIRGVRIENPFKGLKATGRGRVKERRGAYHARTRRKKTR
ncbi:MAG: PIN domain-containing protein [Kiritimatiellia bacterium]